MYIDLEHFDSNGPFVLEPHRFVDRRGNFSKIEIPENFSRSSWPISVCSSLNRSAFTLRGLHMQLKPAEERKVVYCNRGSLIDVVVDLRPKSNTLGDWSSLKISADNGIALYIPPGFAHGFQTLEVDTEVNYVISGPYSPKNAIALNPFDENLGISWPGTTFTISDSDRQAPDFREVLARIELSES